MKNELFDLENWEKGIHFDISLALRSDINQISPTFFKCVICDETIYSDGFIIENIEGVDTFLPEIKFRFCLDHGRRVVGRHLVYCLGCQKACWVGQSPVFGKFAFTLVDRSFCCQPWLSAFLFENGLWEIFHNEMRRHAIIVNF